ncbi:hypothetical protein [Candidatus Synechococcus spongiarum]|uniref:hypothetical protein n=1 Tax=Candidatus Synechococcus spongiarum TaxID=431041 RepID=UPI0004BAB676|nr:hypothetical protein [Candidatus Synechococcus spongiarum]
MKRQEVQNLRILPWGHQESTPFASPAPGAPQPQAIPGSPHGDNGGETGGQRQTPVVWPSPPPSQPPPLRPLDPETNEFDLGDIPPFQG